MRLSNLKSKGLLKIILLFFILFSSTLLLINIKLFILLEKTVQNKAKINYSDVPTISQYTLPTPTVIPSIITYPALSPNKENVVLFSSIGNHKIFNFKSSLLEDIISDESNKEYKDLSELLKGVYDERWNYINMTGRLHWLDDYTFSVIYKSGINKLFEHPIQYIINFSNLKKITINKKEIPVNPDFDIVAIDPSSNMYLGYEYKVENDFNRTYVKIYNFESAKFIDIAKAWDVKLISYDKVNNGFVVWDVNKDHLSYKNGSKIGMVLYFYSLDTKKVTEFNLTRVFSEKTDFCNIQNDILSVVSANRSEIKVLGKCIDNDIVEKKYLAGDSYVFSLR